MLELLNNSLLKKEKEEKFKNIKWFVILASCFSESFSLFSYKSHAIRID